MNASKAKAPTLYKVVSNGEQQYSLWRSDLPVPEGWSAQRFVGTKEECLVRIGNLWSDIRPKSCPQRPE